MSWSSQLIDIGRSADSTWTEFIAADESASLSFCSLLRPRRKLCRVVSSRPRSRPTRSTCLDFKVSKSYNMTERKLPVSSRPGYFCGLHDVHAIGPPATQQRLRAGDGQRSHVPLRRCTERRRGGDRRGGKES